MWSRRFTCINGLLADSARLVRLGGISNKVIKSVPACDTLSIMPAVGSRVVDTSASFSEGHAAGPQLDLVSS